MKLNKIALGVALAAGAATVQASDVLMFPYVVSGGSVTTLVSVINTERNPTALAGLYYNFNGSAVGSYDSASTRFLHWRYHIKTANTAASTCYENNGYFPTSPLDMVTYDVSGLRGVDGVMFNDPSVNNNWQAAGPANQLSAITLSGERGVLFVHNAGSTGGALAGEALVVEFDTGAAWGYQAVANDSTGVAAAANFDFSTLAPQVSASVSLMPLGEVVTRFFVTPVNDPAAPNQGTTVVSTPTLLDANGIDFVGDNWFGGMRTLVDLTPLTGSIRVVNRDEGGISGGVTPQPVTCVWPVDATNLITAANVLAYANTQGGFVNLTTNRLNIGATDLAAGVRPTQNAHVVKLEFRPAGAGGQFDMPVGVGAFNNAFRIE